MSEPRTPLTAHRQRLAQLGMEIRRIGSLLSQKEQLLAGLLHALRAVIAASLGYYAARGLGLEQGFWAAITALSVTQNHYAEVRNASRDQFMGAMIGGLIGLAAAMLGHDHYAAYVLAVIVGMMLCSALNLGGAGRIGGITTTIIMLVPHTGTFWQFALFRLGEVSLGAFAALLVSVSFDAMERRWFGDHPST